MQDNDQGVWKERRCSLVLQTKRRRHFDCGGREAWKKRTKRCELIRQNFEDWKVNIAPYQRYCITALFFTLPGAGSGCGASRLVSLPLKQHVRWLYHKNHLYCSITVLILSVVVVWFEKKKKGQTFKTYNRVVKRDTVQILHTLSCPAVSQMRNLCSSFWYCTVLVMNDALMKRKRLYFGFFNTKRQTTEIAC